LKGSHSAFILFLEINDFKGRNQGEVEEQKKFNVWESFPLSRRYHPKQTSTYHANASTPECKNSRTTPFKPYPGSRLSAIARQASAT